MLPGRGQGDLAIGVLYFLALLRIGHHLPTPEGLVIPGQAVDGHAGIGLTAQLLARGRGQGSLHGLEDDLLGHILLVGDGLDH